MLDVLTKLEQMCLFQVDVLSCKHQASFLCPSLHLFFTGGKPPKEGIWCESLLTHCMESAFDVMNLILVKILSRQRLPTSESRRTRHFTLCCFHNTSINAGSFLPFVEHMLTVAASQSHHISPNPHPCPLFTAITKESQDIDLDLSCALWIATKQSRNQEWQNTKR